MGAALAAPSARPGPARSTSTGSPARRPGSIGFGASGGQNSVPDALARERAGQPARFVRAAYAAGAGRQTCFGRFTGFGASGGRRFGAEGTVALTREARPVAGRLTPNRSDLDWEGSDAGEGGPESAGAR